MYCLTRFTMAEIWSKGFRFQDQITDVNWEADGPYYKRTLSLIKVSLFVDSGTDFGVQPVNPMLQNHLVPFWRFCNFAAMYKYSYLLTRACALRSATVVGEQSPTAVRACVERLTTARLQATAAGAALSRRLFC